MIFGMESQIKKESTFTYELDTPTSFPNSSLPYDQRDEQKSSGNSCSSSCSLKNTNQEKISNIDLLNSMELEANKIAAAVDGLTENLTGILRSISALTLDCLETYRNSICKTCDTIDHNIKLMYQLMAKCEELNNVAVPLTTMSQNVKELRNILDLFESSINHW